MSLKEILLSLIAIIIVVVVPHSGIIPIPFGYAIPVLVFTWFFLRRKKESFETIGFTFKRFGSKSVFIGILSGILLFSFLTWVFFPLLEKIVELPPANLGDFAKIKGNTGFYVFLLAMSWIIGGFYEELVFHGFIFTRLEKVIAGNYASLVSFLLTNIIFAVYHWQLGLFGVINALIAGMFYHSLMLYYKRNMWYAIFCHAIYDTIALTYMYVGYG
ncbi:MAG: CPBP family intramembrane glutamic endopeptidase [Chitinophagaceae bacterium]